LLIIAVAALIWCRLEMVVTDKHPDIAILWTLCITCQMPIKKIFVGAGCEESSAESKHCIKVVGGVLLAFNVFKPVSGLEKIFGLRWAVQALFGI
jgi:ABC-type lipoprotein release transport system permease subunit